MKSMIFAFCIVLSLPFIQCNSSSSVLPPDSDSSCFYRGVDTCQQKQNTYHLHLDLSDTHQTIHSFGASDCWTTKFIGEWADVKKKNRIADLLFSTDTLDNGTPEGIGLSMWRFNIGAGSFEQGTGSGIKTDWRREACFLQADGSYDWSKQAGQQWFLQAARKRGVPYTLGFAISPPVSMTKNGKAFSPGGHDLNIKEERLEDYVVFLATVAEHFRFDFISPVNEPQWDWEAGADGRSSQEGSPALNSEIAALTRQLSEALTQREVAAKVIIGEAGQWDFLYSRNTDGRGNQIRQFFDPASPEYMGDLPQVAHAISAHSYFTTCPDEQLVQVRQQVAAQVQKTDPSLATWQTEFGVLGNICDTYSGAPRHTGMDYGLYVAKVIHHDLTLANVSSWQWWLAVNPYNYSDGLVYINAPSGVIDPENCKEDGVVVESKQLWSLGNYARFVRPGMQRVTAEITELPNPVGAASELMVSAFIDVTEKRLVVVVVNMSSSAKWLALDEALSEKIEGSVFNAYTTNAHVNLERTFMKKDSLRIAGQSVVTLTARYR